VLKQQKTKTVTKNKKDAQIHQVTIHWSEE